MDTSVQPAGPSVAVSQDEFCSPTLLFVQDILSGREFLIDSGASVSVFPGPRSSSVDGVGLLTADGSSMFCSGSRLIPLRFSCGSGSRVYTWNFQLAPVSIPLLGADFLQHFNLLVDIKGRKLVHADCPDDVVIQASPGPQPAFESVSFLSAPQAVQNLLKDFPDVLSSNGFTASKPGHGVKHHLLTHPGLCQTSETRPGEACCCPGRILRHGESWDNTEILLSVVLPSAHGSEEGRRMASLWGLQKTEQSHHPGQVPFT